MASLTFNDVTFRYPGQSDKALLGCSLKIPSGRRVALIGQNGSGKSTLFLHCNGILKPESGQISIDGHPIKYDRKALAALRQQVGIVFQNADDQLFSASIEQDISFGPLNLGLPHSEVRERIAEVAAACQIEHLLERPTHALSGGQKARAALAGVLAMRPDILLIDEPTANLDPHMRRRIFRILAQLTAAGKTIVLATHEYEIARYWADYIIVMDAGKVALSGASDHVFAQTELLEKIGLNAPWHADLFEKTKL